MISSIKIKLSNVYSACIIIIIIESYRLLSITHIGTLCVCVIMLRYTEPVYMISVFSQRYDTSKVNIAENKISINFNLLDACFHKDIDKSQYSQSHHNADLPHSPSLFHSFVLFSSLSTTSNFKFVLFFSFSHPHIWGYSSP